MSNTNKARSVSSGYKIKDTYPNRTFTPSDQQRIANQISGLLTREKSAKAGKTKE